MKFRHSDLSSIASTPKYTSNKIDFGCSGRRQIVANFNAARAALLALGVPVEPDISSTERATHNAQHIHLPEWGLLVSFCDFAQDDRRRMPSNADVLRDSLQNPTPIAGCRGDLWSPGELRE
ncbi:MAG: hypothetical protein LBE22_04335 [Azoarcus sp.]|nr:hypothetical protein [Azoarcus sp.]